MFSPQTAGGGKPSGPKARATHTRRHASGAVGECVGRVQATRDQGRQGHQGCAFHCQETGFRVSCRGSAVAGEAGEVAASSAVAEAGGVPAGSAVAGEAEPDVFLLKDEPVLEEDGGFGPALSPQGFA